MKFNLILLIIFIFGTNTNAQNHDFKLNENICYCVGGSPLSIVKLDNNWELLLFLRQPKTTAKLDSLEIKYTHSQLKLLKQWNLIKDNVNDFYQTSIVILDSIKTESLRNYSKQLSLNLVNEIEPKVLELKSHLKSIKREKNIYSILFSYIIDGMIWKYMEKENLVDPREIALNKPNWNGEYWTLYPKRNFYCGTNSISDNGYSIKVNWSEEAIPKMIPFVTRFDLLGKILNDFIEKGKLDDEEAIDVFGKYNFFDNHGNFTVPIIIENDQDKVYTISKEISVSIISFIKSKIDLETLKMKLGFRDTSQTLIILYHEMIWDVMSTLENKKIIEKPIAFKYPKQTKPEDIGDIIILVKK